MVKSKEGKKFEGEFVKSFNFNYGDRKEFAIVRLKDCGTIKRADVGDYLVFYKNVVLNIELKAQENGILYTSEIRDSQFQKWLSFEYQKIRIPIWIIKNESTREIAIYFKTTMQKLYKGTKITPQDADFIIKYNNGVCPYNLAPLFTKIDEYVK
ncbi:MAG: hypothetical protein QXU98_14440 [Candidatus Parvarchaeota archaeon]